MFYSKSMEMCYSFMYQTLWSLFCMIFQLFMNMKSIGFVLLPDEVGCAVTNPMASCPNSAPGYLNTFQVFIFSAPTIALVHLKSYHCYWALISATACDHISFLLYRFLPILSITADYNNFWLLSRQSYPSKIPTKYSGQSIRSPS